MRSRWEEWGARYSDWNFLWLWERVKVHRGGQRQWKRWYGWKLISDRYVKPSLVRKRLRETRVSEFKWSRLIRCSKRENTLLTPFMGVSANQRRDFAKNLWSSDGRILITYTRRGWKRSWRGDDASSSNGVDLPNAPQYQEKSCISPTQYPNRENTKEEGQ